MITYYKGLINNMEKNHMNDLDEIKEKEAAVKRLPKWAFYSFFLIPVVVGLSLFAIYLSITPNYKVYKNNLDVTKISLDVKTPRKDYAYLSSDADGIFDFVASEVKVEAEGTFTFKIDTKKLLSLNDKFATDSMLKINFKADFGELDLSKYSSFAEKPSFTFGFEGETGTTVDLYKYADFSTKINFNGEKDLVFSFKDSLIFDVLNSNEQEKFGYTLKDIDLIYHNV